MINAGEVHMSLAKLFRADIFNNYFECERCKVESTDGARANMTICPQCIHSGGHVHGLRSYYFMSKDTMDNVVNQVKEIIK